MTTIQGLIEAENWLRTHIGYPPLAGARGGKKMQTQVGQRIRMVKSPHRSDPVGSYGRVVRTEHGEGCQRIWVELDNNLGRSCFLGENIGYAWEVVDGTLEYLKTGDVIEKTKESEATFSLQHDWSLRFPMEPFSSSFKRTVLAVLDPGVYALSRAGQPDVGGGIYTAAELKREGYTVKGALDETVKMTVSEISKKLGHEVEIIKEAV